MKTIFEKAWIIEAQALNAMKKEFSDWSGKYHVVKGDDRKFRVELVEVATTAPAGWTEVEADELPSNVDLGQALAESGETLADLKDGDRVANATMDGAFVMPENCPHCGIGLDNGIGHHDQDVNGKLVKHEKFQFECLGCGEEFGPAIGTKAERPRLSKVIRPTKMVWEIADSMPKASRKEVMEACVNAGIAYGTSRTQYQAWFKASQEAKRVDIRQPYEKGEK